jgi:hypothetical protein
LEGAKVKIFTRILCHILNRTPRIQNEYILDINDTLTNINDSSSDTILGGKDGLYDVWTRIKPIHANQ